MATAFSVRYSVACDDNGRIFILCWMDEGSNEFTEFVR